MTWALSLFFSWKLAVDILSVISLKQELRKLLMAIAVPKIIWSSIPLKKSSYVRLVFLFYFTVIAGVSSSIT